MNKNKSLIEYASEHIKLMDIKAKIALPSPFATSKSAKNLKIISAPVPRYFENASQIKSQYADSEWDLSAVFKLIKYEPYFLKAVQKKQSLIIKSGFKIKSENDEVTKYFQARFTLMELQTGLSVKKLVNKISYYLLVCSNAFIIKVRGDTDGYANPYMKNGKEIKPVIGLFTVHPTLLKPKFKQKKVKGVTCFEIEKWIFTNSRGSIIEFDPEDIAHFTLLKEDGMLFGMPEVIPVIDDIRTLRKIEEDVQLLLYRDLFPIIHYTIENPVIIDHKNEITEIDFAKKDMESLIQDGGLVTDSRHKIALLGSDGKHIDAIPYLEYFQKRIFSGFGMSATDVGQAQETNANVANSMSKQLTDAVRFIQNEIADQFDEMILTEMMLQSPYGLSGLSEENRPSFDFNETDIEWKIRQENHEADLFAKGLKTVDECRNKLKMKSIDEAGLDRTFQGLYGQIETDQAKQIQAARPTVGIRAKIPNKSKGSAAKRDSIKSANSNSNIIKAKDELCQSSILTIQDEFKEVISNSFGTGPIENRNLVDKVLNRIFVTLNDEIKEAFIAGSMKASDTYKVENNYDINILKNINDNLTRIKIDIKDKLSTKDYINKASSRLATTSRTEVTRAFNMGFASTCVNNNMKNFEVSYENEEINNEYSELIGSIITIEEQKDIYSKVPPFRPNSRLRIKSKV